MIVHCNVALTIEAAIVALNEEGEREWILFIEVFDLWNKCKFSDLDITASSVCIDGSNCDFDFSWWIVLVQIDDLDVGGLLLANFDERVTQLILEEN